MQRLSPEKLAKPAAPKRIVFYNHTGLISGAEHMLLLTLAHLDRSRFTPIVACPAQGGLQQACEALGVPTRSTDLVGARFTGRPDKLIRYALSTGRASIRVRRLLRSLEPDLVHANSIRAGIVASTALIGSRIPVLWHVHDMLRPHPISTFVRILAVLCRRTSFVACSESAAKTFRGKLIRRFRPNAVSVAHNGIDTSKSAPANARESVRKELNLGEEHFLLGIVGQVTPRKGHESLIRVFAEFSRSCPQTRLLIVGRAVFPHDEIYMAKLKQLCENLELTERVHFLGQRSDIPQVMKALDLLVLNSDREPFGLVILEAMLQGTPVLATSSGGPSEIIEHDVTGHLVPVGQQRELLSALTVLHNNADLRQTYSREGPEHVRARFSVETYMKTIHAVLHDTLSRRRSPSGPMGALSAPCTENIAEHV